jgi:hypothetical protein
VWRNPDSDVSGAHCGDVEVVRVLFDAWRAGDAAGADDPIALGFVITSLQDARIDRVGYKLIAGVGPVHSPPLWTA